MIFNCVKIPRHKSSRPEGDVKPFKCEAQPTSRTSITMPRKLSDPEDTLFQREKSLSKHRIQGRFSFEVRREEAVGSISGQMAEIGIINMEALKPDGHG